MQNPSGALLAILVVAFLPGVLLFRTLHPRGHLLECLAIAPPLSLAVVFLLGHFTALTGLPFGPPLFFGVVGFLAAAALGTKHRTRREQSAEGRRGKGTSTASRYGVALLLVGIGLSGVTWLAGTSGPRVTPPYRDSANHGLMAARVARLQTMEMDKVLASEEGNEDATGGTAFYPLALHGEVALAHRIAGVTIADGFLAATIVFAALVLPIGFYLLARFLIPESSLVAGLAVILYAGLGFFPFLPVRWGMIALIVGVAMVPAAAVVLARYLRVGGERVQACTAALAAVGIFATHPSEVPLLLLLTGSLLAQTALQSGGWALLRVATRRAVVLGTICLAMLLPILGSVMSGASERSGIDGGPEHTLAAASVGLIRQLSFPRRVDALALLALVGLGFCLWRRRHFAMVFTLASLLALCLVAAVVDGPLRGLTAPWYNQSPRIAYNLVLVVPFFAAVALATTASAQRRQLGPFGLTSRARVAAAITLASVLAVTGSLSNIEVVRYAFRGDVLVDADSLAAFSYLDASVRTDEQVLNDVNSDGGLWMYAFHGIAPALALDPAEPNESWRERLWLLAHLPDLGPHPQVEALLAKYRVRFVYLNDRHFVDDFPHYLSAVELQSTPGICERFHRGTSHVFEVVPSGDCT